MTDALLLTIPLVILFTLVSGYHAGIEMAAYRFNRARLRLRRLEGESKAELLGRMIMDKPQGFIGMTLIGTNLSVYLATMVVTRFYKQAPVPDRWAEVVATATLTPILFLFAEVVPKTVMGLHADWFLYRTARLLQVISWILKPFVWIINGLSRLVSRGGQGDTIYEFNRSRVKDYLVTSATRGELGHLEGAMIENAIELRHRRVEQAIIPTNRVNTVFLHATREQVEALSQESTHRRFPVVDDRGKMIGVINIVEILLEVDGDIDLVKLTRRLPEIRHDRTVFEALSQLRGSKTYMAAVVDDQGNQLGIVTVKDLVQLVVGKWSTW